MYLIAAAALSQPDSEELLTIKSLGAEARIHQEQEAGQLSFKEESSKHLLAVGYTTPLIDTVRH